MPQPPQTIYHPFDWGLQYVLLQQLTFETLHESTIPQVKPVGKSQSASPELLLERQLLPGTLCQHRRVPWKSVNSWTSRETPPIETMPRLPPIEPGPVGSGRRVPRWLFAPQAQAGSANPLHLSHLTNQHYPAFFEFCFGPYALGLGRRTMKNP